MQVGTHTCGTQTRKIGVAVHFLAIQKTQSSFPETSWLHDRGLISSFWRLCGGASHWRHFAVDCLASSAKAVTGFTAFSASVFVTTPTSSPSCQVLHQQAAPLIYREAFCMRPKPHIQGHRRTKIPLQKRVWMSTEAPCRTGSSSLLIILIDN